jgi:hypothetical protein
MYQLSDGKNRSGTARKRTAKASLGSEWRRQWEVLRSEGKAWSDRNRIGIELIRKAKA